MDFSQLLEMMRLSVLTYVPKRSPKAASPNPTPPWPAPVENSPYVIDGLPPSPYGTAFGGVSGAGGVLAAGGAGGAAFFTGGVLRTFGSGIGSAFFSFTGGAAGCSLL